MSAPAYFFPGKSGANPKHFADVGIPDDVGEGAEFGDVLDSPMGRGVLATWSRSGESFTVPSFSVAAYTWHAAPADDERELEAGRFHVGVPKDGVKPSDLTKRTAYAGYPLTLADGQIWRIASLDNLPRKLTLDDRGRFVATVKQEHLGLISLADQFTLQFFTALGQIELLKAAKPDLDPNSTVEFTLENAADFAVEILRLNYRVCRELVHALGLFDQQAVGDIVKAAIELTAILKGRVDQAPQTVTVTLR